ncbi:MAG: hypothetical protein QXO27_04495 [Candidatus Aenigmatarchaeota archaeon]
MNKAQVSSIVQIFELMLGGILAVALGYTLVGGHASITQISYENELERHSITLANAFSSNPSTVYWDGNKFYRDIFDSKKLNNLMVTKNSFTSDWKNNLQPNPTLSSILSYPDSYSLIIILDLENSNNAWVTSLSGPNDKFDLNKFIDCLKTNVVDSDIAKLFDLNNLNTNLHEIFKIEKCGSFYSGVLDYGFPVSIRYSDNEIHAGLLKVLVVE